MISTTEPGRMQKRLALGFVVVLAVAFTVIVGQLGAKPLARLYAVVPAFATAMFITDLLTAFLLFSQFAILRLRALIVISCGYLYTAFIVVSWAMTFPGVFSRNGLLGAGIQTTLWLYLLWHAGFALFVSGYALLKDKSEKGLSRGPVGVTIFLSVLAVAAVVVALTLLVTTGQDLLPVIGADSIYSTRSWPFWLWGSAALMAVPGVLLWLRRDSVLDLWLMVVTFSFSLELLLASGLSGRFSIEWYATRAIALLSASFVLFALLFETTTLYARLLSAHLAQRRERSARLLTGDVLSASIAHEVRQPLAAMTINANAGLRWLARPNPDLVETKAALQRIVSDGHRVGEVIKNIRAVFKKDDGYRTMIDLGDLVTETLGLVRADLRSHRVRVEADVPPRLPHVSGDHIRLQQVFLNLFANAIEAMSEVNDRERVLGVQCDRGPAGGVVVRVEDAGLGIAPGDLDRVFDLFFTTKPEGMGLGLALCHSIVEAHGGSLRVLPGRSRGAAFELVLPARASQKSAQEQLRMVDPETGSAPSASRAP
jgi:signal transduction histidine kinase